jgi:hypothetical protein
MVFGVYNAVAQYYRFAAADAASAEFKAKAISLVLAGGLVGGIVGPEVSKHTVDLLATRYLGAYLSRIGFLVLVVGVVQLLDIPSPAGDDRKDSARPLKEIMAQLLMTATPLAMRLCGLNWLALPFITVAAGAVLWLLARRQVAA